MHHHNLPEVVILLCAAVIIVAAFKRLRLSSVLGYLVAGLIIGPFGVQIGGSPLIEDFEASKLFGEYGVVLLMFVIGLELSIERLMQMRRHVFGFGTLQLLLTCSGIACLAFLMKASPAQALVIGGGLALSSTAVVMQIIQEKNSHSSQIGRLSLATLIMQDLAVAPLLFLVPMLNQGTDHIYSDLAMAMAKAAVVLAVIFFVGMRLMRPIYHSIASLESEELFIATTILIVLGSAWITDYFGLSQALGAFVAGLLIAETEFKAQVEADIMPFKGLLLGLFFMTVGMSLDIELLVDKFFIIIGLAISLMLFKTVIITLLARAFGFRNSVALQTGILVSQGSEFSFVLFGLASKGVVPILDNSTSQMLLMVVTISIALTPLAVYLGGLLVKYMAKTIHDPFIQNVLDKETLDLQQHIIIAGFGRVGHTISRLLEEENINNFVAIDSDPKNVHQGRKDGAPVYYGKADRMDILKSLGIDRAKMIIITIRNHNEALSAVKAIRSEFENLPILVRAWDPPHAEILREAGATLAMAETFESSLLLGGAMLNSLGVANTEVKRVLNKFRAQEAPNSQLNDLVTDTIEHI
jgi:monovalent cation:H+ antiporter-2, CPA2 family